MNAYTYYGKHKSGAVVMLFSIFADEKPTAELINTIYRQATAQQGIGAVPRPSLYTVAEMHELPDADDAPAQQRPVLVVPKNGESAP